MSYLRRKQNKIQGFTLVEIIVVVFIIAVMGLTAAMTLGGGTTSERARDSATQLKSLLSVAEQEAILSQRQIGIIFHAAGYSFAQFDSNKQDWKPLDNDRILGETHQLPRDVELLVTVEGKEVTPSATLSNPQLVVTSQGNQTPFAVGISHKGTLQYWLVGHASGTVEIVDATE